MTKFGLQLWSQQTDWPGFRDAALAAEEAGWDSVWTWDHLNAIFGPWEQPIFEGWSVLDGLGPLTSRVRLGLMVGANTFRNPGHTAKLATTLDHLSDGRAVLGIGGAWFEREHDAYGIDFGAGFGERLDRLDEAVMLMRRLLDGERFSHEGRFYTFHDALCQPRPVQAHLPILVGGSGPRKTLRTVALRADAWNTSGTVDEVRDKLEILAEHCADVGRDIARSRRPSASRSSSATTARMPSAPTRRCSSHNGVEDMGHGALLGSSDRGGRRATAVRRDGLRDRHRPDARTVRPRDDRPDGRGPRAAGRVTVVALAGGTGGAKLAHGLQTALAPGELTVVVNTGDDTERHGLLVMPDHDAVMYMLAGRFDDERGWGVAGETWTVMDALTEYGEESWFRLGDRDFATHIATDRAASRGPDTDRRGPARSSDALGIPTAILPMADEPVRTQVRTDEGWMDFQEYFVHRHQGPEVREVRFDGDRGADARRSRRGARACRGDRHRAVEPDRLDRADPRRAGSPRASKSALARACRSSRSARSSVGSRSRVRPTGCWCRSGTNRAPGESPGSTRDIATGFVLDTIDAALEPRSRHSGRGPSSPTRSWPITRVGPAWPAPCSTSRDRRDPDRGDHPGRDARGRQDPAGRHARRGGAAGSRRWPAGTDRRGRVGRRSPRRRVGGQPGSRGPARARPTIGRTDAAPAVARPQCRPCRGARRTSSRVARRRSSSCPSTSRS